MANPRIDAEALVVAYAMSRMGESYLRARGAKTWKQAYEEVSDALGVKPTSCKNLRQEFDPFVSTVRKGWWGREMRLDRAAVMHELSSVSDEALLQLVDRSLRRDEEAIGDVVDAILEPPTRLANVAERLLTGRRAEEYLLSHWEHILGIPFSGFIDRRQDACGFDFAHEAHPPLAIEVKGLKQTSGVVQFTDREWLVAGERKDDYLLVIVGNLAKEPLHRVIRHPQSELDANCILQRTVSATWRANVRL